jgi:hypothetical protein
MKAKLKPELVPKRKPEPRKRKPTHVKWSDWNGPNRFQIGPDPDLPNSKLQALKAILSLSKREQI